MNFFDFIILVVAPKKIGLNRYIKNGGEKKCLTFWIKIKLKKKKIKYCDYLIVNNKSLKF